MREAYILSFPSSIGHTTAMPLSVLKCVVYVSERSAWLSAICLALIQWVLLVVYRVRILNVVCVCVKSLFFTSNLHGELSHHRSHYLLLTITINNIIYSYPPHHTHYGLYSVDNLQGKFACAKIHNDDDAPFGVCDSDVVDVFVMAIAKVQKWFGLSWVWQTNTQTDHKQFRSVKKLINTLGYK